MSLKVMFFKGAWGWFKGLHWAKQVVIWSVITFSGGVYVAVVYAPDAVEAVEEFIGDIFDKKSKELLKENNEALEERLEESAKKHAEGLATKEDMQNIDEKIEELDKDFHQHAIETNKNIQLLTSESASERAAAKILIERSNDRLEKELEDKEREKRGDVSLLMDPFKDDQLSWESPIHIIDSLFNYKPEEVKDTKKKIRIFNRNKNK